MAKVISFFGADSSVGTTMIAQSFAEAMRDDKKRTLLILASSNPMIDYYDIGDDIERSIDEIRPLLRSKTLSKADVLNICYIYKNLYILPPIKDLTLIRYFSEDAIKDIAKVVDDDFDYIVVDGGSSIQYPLNISSIISCNQLFIVISQQEKSVGRYKLLSETVLKPLELEYGIIINKYYENNYYDTKYIEKITGIKEIYSVKHCENSWESEIKKETLLKYPKFRESISNVVRETQKDSSEGYFIGKRSKKKIFGGLNA